jgi:hypothetical protein
MRIQQTLANLQSLHELAALLAAITEVAQKNKNKGHTFFKDLDRWAICRLNNRPLTCV